MTSGSYYFAIGIAGAVVLLASSTSCGDSTGVTASGARSKTHLELVQDDSSFNLVPSGTKLVEQHKRLKCDHGTPPVIWRIYNARNPTAARAAADDAAARWRGRGWVLTRESNVPGVRTFQRSFGSWTASLTLLVKGDTIDVEARDASQGYC
jgi:hypothetical protein